MVGPRSMYISDWEFFTLVLVSLSIPVHWIGKTHYRNGL